MRKAGYFKKYRRFIVAFSKKHPKLSRVVPVIAVAIIGTSVILLARAATFSISIEPETGTKTGVTAVSDTTASGSSAVQFGLGSTGGRIKIMPLGDSITEGGNGATDTANGYRLNLLNDFVGSGYTIDYVGANSGGDSRLLDKDHNGYSGNCIKRDPCGYYGSNTLYAQTAGWLNAYNPDVVIMQGGTNDFYGSITEEQVEVWFEDWVNLVFTTKPNVRIVAFGGPWKTNYYTFAKNFVLAQKASGKKIDWVLYDGIELADGTHPSSAGYKTLADRLTPTIKTLLTN